VLGVSGQDQHHLECLVSVKSELQETSNTLVKKTPTWAWRSTPFECLVSVKSEPQETASTLVKKTPTWA